MICGPHCSLESNIRPRTLIWFRVLICWPEIVMIKDEFAVQVNKQISVLDSFTLRPDLVSHATMLLSDTSIVNFRIWRSSCHLIAKKILFFSAAKLQTVTGFGDDFCNLKEWPEVWNVRIALEEKNNFRWSQVLLKKDNIFLAKCSSLEVSPLR